MKKLIIIITICVVIITVKYTGLFKVIDDMIPNAYQMNQKIGSKIYNQNKDLSDSIFYYQEKLFKIKVRLDENTDCLNQINYKKFSLYNDMLNKDKIKLDSDKILYQSKLDSSILIIKSICKTEKKFNCWNDYNKNLYRN